VAELREGAVYTTADISTPVKVGLNIEKHIFAHFICPRQTGLA
jgi:hypothetical protein